MGDPERSFNFDEMLQPIRAKRLGRVPSLVRTAVRLVWRAGRRELVAAALVQVTTAVAIAAQLLFGQRLLRDVLAIEQGRSGGRVLLPLAGFVIAAAAATFANLARVEQQRVLGELVGRDAMQSILDVTTTVDLLAYESPGFHNRLQRAQVTASSRPLQMTNALLGASSAAITLAGATVALAVIEPLLLGLLVAAFAPAWIASARASRATYDFTVEQTELDRRRWYLAMVLSRKEEAAEVRSFELGPVLRQEHDNLYASRIHAVRAVARRRMRLGMLGAALATLLLAGVIGLLVLFVDTGRLDAAGAGAAAAAIVVLTQRLQSLLGNLGSLYESALYMEDFTDFVADSHRRRGETPGAVPPDGWITLTVEDVHFRYPSRDSDAIDGVSFDARAGEVLALVGDNGSGKTTLAKLLAGLYQPTQGSIQWDGADLADCDPTLVRDQVSVIFQDFARFQLSVHDNIALGRADRRSDRRGVEAAAVSAQIASMVSALPGGYDTFLGPQFFGGVDLSVGQWQRLALARAYFRDAPFVILDEPTASLDATAEAELFEDIRRLFAGRTVLLISHRFSTVRSADRIIVLERGRVIEQGTHADLLELRGRYSTMFRAQAAPYML